MADNSYKPKVWNAICDSCGFKFKSDKLKKRWDGLMVDAACWEMRNPQDFLRAVRETSNVLPWTRPEVDEPDVSPTAWKYVADGYWDHPAVVPPALSSVDTYTTSIPV